MTYIKTSLTKKEVDIFFFKTIFKSNFFYFIFGIFIAFFSSLPVIDVESGFWLNDESKFYLWAKNDIVGLTKGYSLT